MTTSNKIQTIVYGGAFNPPTIAHQVILQTCVDYAKSIGAEIWMLPSGNRMDKIINAEEQQRIDFIGAMISDVNTDNVNIDIITTELTRTIPVETYDTIMEFNEAYPERSFTWVFGADSTETMAEWKNGEWLLENTEMLVLERPGSVINPEVKHGQTMTIPSLDVSSTEVRRRIVAGEDFKDLVGYNVHRMLTSVNALV